MKNAKNRSGFTLVEILIVVVILGILAAIVIPQFSQASEDARASSVQSNLQMVRSQIELYKIQHGGALPGEVTATLQEAMTGKTDLAGAADASGEFGPYMQEWPTNAINGLDAVNVVTDAATAASTSTSHGWWYNSATGEFRACNEEPTDSIDW